MKTCALSLGLVAAVATLTACSPQAEDRTSAVAAPPPKAADESFDAQIDQNSAALLAEGRKILEAHGLPTLEFPDVAAKVMANLVTYSQYKARVAK